MDRSLAADGSDKSLKQRMDHLRLACKQAGVRLTPQRMEIFREVAGRIDHPNADAVFRAVRARMPTLSLDTVYRTLALLKELGLVTSLGPRRESVRFDAHLEPHHHYVCVRCGMTRDLSLDAVSVDAAPAALSVLGTMLSTRVEVQGICRNCAEKVAEKKGVRKRGGTR